MTYRLEWMRSASDELEAILSDSDVLLRDALEQAIDRIELRLSLHPLDEGESREGDERIAFFFPLIVEYFVLPMARLVTVFHVRVYGTTK